jgi:hypothetical protein
MYLYVTSYRLRHTTNLERKSRARAQATSNAAAEDSE